MNLRRLKHLFLPHSDTHAKAHLISPAGLFAWVALFIILQVSLSLVNTVRPGILGVSANIDYKEVIRLVNIEREKKGLEPLTENDNLNVAAYKKGQNMFEEQYWAHYSPSGKDPWGFITGAGYKYSYAGENLARNFTNANDAVIAWMNSPTHRDNILNSKYRDIGISVVQGTLNGEQTTLIVQEFGTEVSYTASAKSFTQLIEDKAAEQAPSVLAQAEIPTVNAEEQESSPASELSEETPAPIAAPVNYIPPTNAELLPSTPINTFTVYRTVGFGIVGAIAMLLFVDLVVMRRRGIYRPAGHHVAHLALLGVAASSLASMSQGKII